MTLFKQSLLKFPADIEFAVPQVIGSAVWNTCERATRLTLGTQARKAGASDPPVLTT